MANRTTSSRLCLIAAVMSLVAPAHAESPAKRRAAAAPPRYVARQRVEVLQGEEWWPATVIAVEKERYRVRTERNEELIVRPVEMRRYTRAKAYPIKAAPEDVAAAHPAPDVVSLTRPGIQPAEPEPAGEEKPKPAEPESEPVAAKPGIPLPPAPNALPNNLPAGNLAAATMLAPPEKVESRVPFQADGFPAPAHAVTKDAIPLRPLEKGDAVFESAVEMLFTSPEFGQAFVPHRERSSEAPAELYYDRYDLATGQRTGGFAVPPGGRVLDLSPDGTRLLVCWASPDSPGAVDDCLGIFVVLNDRLSLRSAWRPYASTRTQTAQAAVDTARFVDATHVLTSAGSDLTCWDADGNRAMYRLYPVSPCKPAVSPNRKFVAVAVGATGWILDAATGQPSLKLPGPLPAAGSFSFRPDSRQVAFLMDDRVLAWNLADIPPTPGQSAGSGSDHLRADRRSAAPDSLRQVSDTTLPLPDAATATTLDWLSDGYVMINRRYCVDLARRVLLWEYVPEDDGVGGSYAGHYWYSVPAAGKERVLAHRPLPHDAALRAAAAVDPATVMAVHPDAKVSVDLSRVDADDALKARAISALTAKLRANGVEVADNQPVRLVVTSAPGETREITYRGSTSGNETTVQVPEDLVTVAFVDDGRTIWQAARPATPPGTLALRPGQSVEDFLAAERSRLRLVAATNVTLPKFVPHARKDLCYGRSTLTAAGPQDADPK